MLHTQTPSLMKSGPVATFAILIPTPVRPPSATNLHPGQFPANTDIRRHIGGHTVGQPQALVPSTETSCVSSLLHAHVTAQTIHRKQHACSRRTTVACGGKQGEPQVNKHPSQTRSLGRLQALPELRRFSPRNVEVTG